MFLINIYTIYNKRWTSFLKIQSLFKITEKKNIPARIVLPMNLFIKSPYPPCHMPDSLKYQTFYIIFPHSVGIFLNISQPIKVSAAVSAA